MKKKRLILFLALLFIVGCGPTNKPIPPVYNPSATPTVQPTATYEWSDFPAERAYELSGQPEPMAPIVFSPDGNLIATGSTDNQILLWDAKDGHLLKTLSGHQEAVTALAFSRDGTLLVSGGNDKTVRLWDLSLTEQVRVFEGHPSGLMSVAISPDNQTIATGSRNYSINNVFYTNGGEVRFWNVDGGYISGWLAGDVTIVYFSPDGSHLIAFAGLNTYHFDAPFRQEPRNTGLRVGTPPVVQAYLPDQDLYVTVFNNSIEFWNAETNEKVKTIKSMTDFLISAVARVRFSPNERIAAGMCSDGIVRFWDATNGRPMGKLPEDAFIVFVAFSPDGKMFAAVSKDEGTWVWKLK
jgi:WD40 repeat protein